MSKLVDLSHKWAVEIGRIFIAFGSIESATHECLRRIPRDPIYSIAKRLTFAQRIDLLEVILNSMEESKAVRLSVLLKQASRLAEQRNLIAHNPLSLDIYTSDVGEHSIRESIRSLRNSEKGISFEQLVEIRYQTEALVIEIYDSQSKLFEEISETKTSRNIE